MLRSSSFEADSQLHDDFNNEKHSQETDTLASVDLVLLHHCKIRCQRHWMISMWDMLLQAQLRSLTEVFHDSFLDTSVRYNELIMWCCSSHQRWSDQQKCWVESQSLRKRSRLIQYLWLQQSRHDVALSLLMIFLHRICRKVLSSLIDCLSLIASRFSWWHLHMLHILLLIMHLYSFELSWDSFVYKNDQSVNEQVEIWVIWVNICK